MNRFEFRRIGVASEHNCSPPSLHDCIEAVLPLADILMRDVLDGLSSLASATSRSSHFSGTLPLSKAMADLLCCHAPSVAEMFAGQLKLGAYGGSPSYFVTGTMATVTDLELLSSEQIDADIEFALALQEVSRGVEDVLPAVDALVCSVAGWTTVQPSLNPLKVEVFVQALLNCMRRFVPDRELRAPLLIPTAGLLGVNLQQFYLEICDWLRSHGVEPSWPVGICMSGEGATAARGSSRSLSRTVATFDRLRRLLSGQAQSNLGSAQDFLPTVPFSYVALEELKLIKPMMQRLSRRESQVEEAHVAQEGTGGGIVMEQARLRQLSRQLSEEVVRLMLDKLTQDERLVPSVRRLALGLESAMLGIAGADPRYFSDHQHPARQVLDWLVSRGRCFRSDDDPGLKAFLGSASAALNALKSPGADAARFASVLGELQSESAPDQGMHHGSIDIETSQWEGSGPQLLARSRSGGRPRVFVTS